MRGLIARMFAVQAPTPAQRLANEVKASLNDRATLRAFAPERNEAKRFARARPMLDRLRYEIASRQAQA